MAQRALIRPMVKSAMQSGRAGGMGWQLEWSPGEAQRACPLTGWAGSGDTRAQLRLRFATQAAAIAYAEARGIAFEVAAAKPPAAIKPKAYADNFRFGRQENWSH